MSVGVEDYKFANENKSEGVENKNVWEKNSSAASLLIVFLKTATL